MKVWLKSPIFLLVSWLQVYGTSKKSVPEFGGSTPNLGETHEDGKVNTWEIGNTKKHTILQGPTPNLREKHTKMARKTHGK